MRHFFLTKTFLGGLKRWDYVLGSATFGIRRYRATCGTSKRLRVHNNKHWDARRGNRDKDDVSDDNDGGIFFENSNVEFDGCYAPEERDPVGMEELLIEAESFLEDEDGQGALKILAVGFDVMLAIQQTLDSCSVVGMTNADVEALPLALMTFAADGGTVRRREITAITVSSLPRAWSWAARI